MKRPIRRGKKWALASRTGHRSIRARRCAEIETFERRNMLTTWAFDFTTGALVIQGTADSEWVGVHYDDQGTPTTADDELILTNAVNGLQDTPQHIPLWQPVGGDAKAPITQIICELGDGHDHFNNNTPLVSIVHGGDGNDVLSGGSNFDFLDGDGDNDYLYGNGGDDILVGDTGSDTLYGGDDNDNLNGGDGFDNLYGGDGNDVLGGGDGMDVLVGGNGDDSLYGGAGMDFLYGDGKGVQGEDPPTGKEGNDTLSGGDGYDYLYGNLGDD